MAATVPTSRLWGQCTTCGEYFVWDHAWGWLDPYRAKCTTCPDDVVKLLDVVYDGTETKVKVEWASGKVTLESSLGLHSMIVNGVVRGDATKRA